jgi:hypothetical protein
MTKIKRPKWLSREFVVMQQYYCLCTSEAQYTAEMKRLGVKPHLRNEWCAPDGGKCHFFERKGKWVVVVCISTASKPEPIQVAAILCHEAVHIWQKEMLLIGEKHPSDEFTAYGIQWIAQQLMYAYKATLK